MVRLWPVVVCLIGCGRLDFAPLIAQPVTLSYPVHELVAVLGVTTLDDVPVVTGGPVAFTISPALPAGLAFDAHTGAIAGTPTQAVNLVSYTVTATSELDPTFKATSGLRLTALPGSVVDQTADVADDNGGTDATCFATAAGGCTLRAAVQTANHQSSPQLVLLAASTYPLASALDPITNDVVIAGQGAVTTKLRAATVHPGYGLASLSTAHVLRLVKLAVLDFGAVNGAAAAVTGGTLSVYACAFVNNTSAGSGGAFYVANGAAAVIETSVFTQNTSFGGCCGGWGGVIDGEGTGTTITVKNTTANQNSAAWGSFSHITTGTTLQLVNSTLTGNTATTAGTLATPGGIYTLVNDTIVYNTNTTTDSAGIYEYSAPCHYTVSNTLVAFNKDSSGSENNCNRRDLSTDVTSLGGNIVSDGGGNCAAYFTGPGDRLMTDPLLDPAGLADNGGLTNTIALRLGSPAIGTGVASQCPSVDQRGLPRPAPSKPPAESCDSGAVEMQ